MSRRLVAWSESAILFAAVWIGVPLVGRILDAWFAWPMWPDPVRAAGAPILAFGLVGLAWSLLALARHGRGTPNPLLPPVALVTSGPFAWTRNPIIGSHFLGSLGASLLAGSPAAVLLVLLLGVPAGRIVRHEERVLEARFGGAYRRYREAVARWIPRPPRRQSR